MAQAHGKYKYPAPSGSSTVTYSGYNPVPSQDTPQSGALYPQMPEAPICIPQGAPVMGVPTGTSTPYTPSNQVAPLVGGAPQPGYAAGTGQLPQSAMWQDMIREAQGIAVRQKVSAMQALGRTCGDNPCCQVGKRYEVYHHGGPHHGQALFSVFERGNCCMRCCCYPAHKAAFSVHPPTVSRSTHEFWSYKPPAELALMTALQPCRCGLCACCHCCVREMTLVHGSVGDNPSRMGRCCDWFRGGGSGCGGGLCCGGGKSAVDWDRNPVIGYATQPGCSDPNSGCCCGGGCIPTLNIFSARHEQQGTLGEGNNQWATLKGNTCCFGGALELCCNFPFYVSSLTAKKGKDGKTEADIAELVKTKPDKDMGFVREIFTDADTYCMRFTSELTPEQKATLLATNILADNILFSQGGILVFCPEPNVLCEIRCCWQYCCGCLWPWKCQFRNDNN